MRKIIIFSCTNRPDSYTLKVCKIYKDLIDKKGIECEIVNFEDLPKTIAFDEQFDNRSENYEAFIEKFIRNNNKFIFVIPEYNGGFPGIFKLFLDSIHPRDWADKKACLVGVSSGRAGNLRGMEHATGVLQYLKMHVFHNKLPISQIDKILNASGQFSSGEQLAVCNNQVNGFINF